MKLISPKVIILGATGMLGRMIYLYLSRKYDNVYGTSRKLESGLINLNAQNTKQIEEIFARINPEYVINCIGILKDGNKKNLKYINSDFPKIISQISKDYRFRIINISTDAVFGDHQGDVDEESIPVPDDEYGKSKMAGEQKINSLNIRTSIIGFDPNKHKGLLEFLIKNKKNNPTGFINQKWSGATTLQLARFIEHLIYNGKFNDIFKKTSIVHFTPIKSSKYDIIEVFASILKLEKPRKRFGKEINRTLKSKYISGKKLNHYCTSLKKALKELINFDQNYVKKYKEN